MTAETQSSCTAKVGRVAYSYRAIIVELRCLSAIIHHPSFFVWAGKASCREIPLFRCSFGITLCASTPLFPIPLFDATAQSTVSLLCACFFQTALRAAASRFEQTRKNSCTFSTQPIRRRQSHSIHNYGNHGLTTIQGRRRYRETYITSRAYATSPSLVIISETTEILFE